MSVIIEVAYYEDCWNVLNVDDTHRETLEHADSQLQDEELKFLMMKVCEELVDKFIQQRHLRELEKSRDDQ